MNMIINKIEKEKKGKLYKLIFSNNTELICNEELIVNNLLRNGKEIDLDFYHKLFSEANIYNFYDKALSYLSRGLKSEYKIYNYLINKEATKEEALSVINILKDKKLLDDYKYFDSLANYYLRNLYGPFYIEQKGKLEHIDCKIIQEVLNNIDFCELENNIEILLNKYIRTQREKDINKLKLKLKKYLYTRGFSVEMINKKVGEL